MARDSGVTRPVEPSREADHTSRATRALWRVAHRGQDKGSRESRAQPVMISILEGSLGIGAWLA
jgi:hypothetical protein